MRGGRAAGEVRRLGPLSEMGIENTFFFLRPGSYKLFWLRARTGESQCQDPSLFSSLGSNNGALARQACAASLEFERALL